MRVRFWGVRGSVPWATPRSVTTGHNTACVHVHDETSGAALVLDAGTGLVGLGRALGPQPATVTILLSHYHWDHIQGLPFFDPCFTAGSDIRVLTPNLESAGPSSLTTLFGPPHFPVPLESLPATLTTRAVEPGPFRVGGFAVRALRLNHPGGCFAYRIAGPSGDLVYATDHEFGDRATDAALTAFATDAAALIIDSHYTPEELPAMTGRGHGSWPLCLALAEAARVKDVWLYHHAPGRSDEGIAALERDARRVRPGVSAAREGSEFVL